MKARTVAREICLSALLLTLVFLPAFAGVKDFSPPAKLGELVLSKSLRGSQALEEIGKLHGKRMEQLKDGLLARYRGSSAEALLWVAEPKPDVITEKLLAAMLAGISRGTSAFAPAREQKFGQMTIYTTQGLGKNHYLYSTAKYVVWLEVTEKEAVKALHDLVKVLK